MTDIMERVNRRKQQKADIMPPDTPSVKQAKQQLSTQPPANQPVTQAAATTPVAQVTIDQPRIEPGTDTRDWRRAASYDEAVKIDPSLTRAGYIGGVSQYRAENGQQPLSFLELYENLRGNDPFKSPEQEAREQQRLRRAERVNAIGNVLANLVNYVRTTNGNPSMQLQPLSAGQARIDRLRQYQDGLARSRYGDYMNLLSQQRADEAARDAAALKFQQQLYLESMKQNSPLAQARTQRELAGIGTEAARQRNIEADRAYTDARRRGQELKNNYISRQAEADLKLTFAKTENERKGGKSKLLYPVVRATGPQGKSKAYDLNKPMEVVAYYKLLEKAGVLDGLTEDEKPKTWKDMREFIIATSSEYHDVKNGFRYAEDDPYAQSIATDPIDEEEENDYS